ncbi:MAG: 2-oxo acid dehydrogenase subunit E2 [Dehalococcoidia bacterium]|nr:2-oxo acid dehydrogenase subunit E2 [Dehalococcoidia bacterium]
MANEITMPSMGADMTEGTIVKWLKNEGDKVSKGDKLAEIETDKTVVEMEAYDEGFLRKITSIEGSVVQVGKIIGYIGDMDEDIPEKAEESKETVITEETSNKIADSTSIKETNSSDSGEEVHNSTKDLQKVDITLSSDSIRIKASPMAKRLANEKNINLADIKGSGPDGRITKDDVEKHVPGPSLVSSNQLGNSKNINLDSSDIQLNTMRQAISRVTVKSKTEIPHFQVTVEVDMTEAMKMRSDINEDIEKNGIKISVNDLVLKATINSLLKYPKWNTSFDGDKLISYSSINLGIAIALEQGLIVPAILDAQNLDLISLASKSKDLGNRARGNGDPLSNQELTSGTFSTSNLGMFGTHAFTAIIVPPQSGIIALGEVKKEAKVINDDIQIRQIMYATLSADHRVGDGAEGALLMKEFKELLEKPSRLLL